MVIHLHHVCDKSSVAFNESHSCAKQLRLLSLRKFSSILNENVFYSFHPFVQILPSVTLWNFSILFQLPYDLLFKYISKNRNREAPLKSYLLGNFQKYSYYAPFLLRMLLFPLHLVAKRCAT